jgi:hypothetical protein
MIGVFPASSHAEAFVEKLSPSRLQIVHALSRTLGRA